jgi:hypothetical protein
MTDATEITAVKPFNRTPQGGLCDAGDVFTVSDTRATELERLGLATRTKAAPAPENKMAPAPSNKAAANTRKPIPLTPKD